MHIFFKDAVFHPLFEELREEVRKRELEQETDLDYPLNELRDELCNSAKYPSHPPHPFLLAYTPGHYNLIFFNYFVQKDWSSHHYLSI